ncbi:MAG: hypothetical protein ACLGI8_05025 [Acidimicrobiia bacterium]
MNRSRTLAGLRRLAPMLALATLPAAPSQAQATAADLVGYDVVATGLAVTAFPVVPALLPVEAPAEVTVSLATATLSSGGQGFGRASTLFPGTPIAGIRPLIEIASGQRLPVPDYPIVVESREFEPAKHNEQPGITMSSDVDADRAVVVADAGGTSIPGVVTVRSARTLSTSLLEGQTVTATSTSTLEQVAIGDALTIDQIVSIARVTSDSVTATCEGEVTISGVSVAGQPATIDERGIHLDGSGSSPAPLGDGGAAAAQPLAATGVTARVLGGADACEGALGSRTTAGLLVSVPLPSAGAVPPGGHVDLVLASTSASAGASVLAAFEAPPFEPAMPTASEVVTRLPGPASGGIALSPSAPVRSSPPAPGTAARPALAAEPVAYSFGGIPVALLLGLGCAVPPVARRVRRYVNRVVALLEPA